MTKLVVAALVGAIVVSAGCAVGQVNFGATSTTTRVVFFQIAPHAGYFLTRPPRVGEAVDIVYVGKDPDSGLLNFQLRTRAP